MHADIAWDTLVRPLVSACERGGILVGTLVSPPVVGSDSYRHRWGSSERGSRTGGPN